MRRGGGCRPCFPPQGRGDTQPHQPPPLPPAMARQRAQRAGEGGGSGGGGDVLHPRAALHAARGCWAGRAEDGGGGWPREARRARATPRHPPSYARAGKHGTPGKSRPLPTLFFFFRVPAGSPPPAAAVPPPAVCHACGARRGGWPLPSRHATVLFRWGRLPTSCCGLGGGGRVQLSVGAAAAARGVPPPPTAALGACAPRGRRVGWRGTDACKKTTKNKRKGSETASPSACAPSRVRLHQ